MKSSNTLITLAAALSMMVASIGMASAGVGSGHEGYDPGPVPDYDDYPACEWVADCT